MQNKKIKILSIFLISIFSLELSFATSGNLSSSIEEKNIKADSTSFLGIKKSNTARILDNFKDQQKDLLFENVPITSKDEELLFNSDSNLNSLEQILKRVNDRKNVLKERKMNVTKKKFTLKNEIETIDNSITDTENEIKEKQEQIVDKNIEIASLTEKIKSLDEKVVQSKKTILEYLSYIYTRQDSMEGEASDIDVIKSIILNDGNIGDMLSDIHFKSIMELSGQNLVELYRSNIKELYYNKEQLKKNKLEIISLKKELDARKIDLDSQKQYKENLLQVTKGQESLYNKFILEKQESENKIKDKIENINSSYADIFNNIALKYDCNIKFGSGQDIEIGDIPESESQKCSQIRNYFTLEKKLRDSNDDLNKTNPLLWPADPSRGISTYFHDEEYFASLGSEHEAIDLRYSQGTDIVAPASGYVYFINPPTPGGYSYMAIKHNNGFMTVYGHLSEIFVKQFDFIKAGQVFAKTGGKPGTPGAGPMTSGPHLHFEVYKDRESVDPLRFLDTTYLSFDNLPTKYRYKYVEDLKLKYGDKKINMSRFEKFYIAGENEFDRQKYLLERYASANFKNWNMWIEEAIDGKIDPSFLICVGMAETGLGNHLKSGYNVGNIGNTDSGGTYDFESPREAIYRMVKTLNNKYLSKYRSIDMLSRWGNKNGSIYASSSKNWHNNVVKCLSSLKGRFIEDDFKFRITDIDY